MPEDSTELKEELRKKRFTYWFRRIGLQLLDSLRVIVAVGGAVVVMLLQIPLFRGPLNEIGVTGSQSFVQGVLVAVLLAIFFEMRVISDRTERSAEQRHFADPLDVYPVLFNRMKTIKRREERVLDVLGMTLYTAWPTITFWLNKPELDGWTIRLTAVVSDPAPIALTPEAWFQESRANLTNIRRMSSNPSIESRGIKLETFSYKFMPVMHGFRLGNGDLFYSILAWQENGLIGRDQYSYEFVPHHDTSASAIASREIFDSWFSRASQTAWPPHEREASSNDN